MNRTLKIQEESLISTQVARASLHRHGLAWKDLEANVLSIKLGIYSGRLRCLLAILTATSNNDPAL
jgi:hypothetical protein